MQGGWRKGREDGGQGSTVDVGGVTHIRDAVNRTDMDQNRRIPMSLAGGACLFVQVRLQKLHQVVKQRGSGVRPRRRA